MRSTPYNTACRSSALSIPDYGGRAFGDGRGDSLRIGTGIDSNSIMYSTRIDAAAG